MKVLPLEEFLALYAPVYPSENRSWDTTVTYMMSDPSEKLIVEQLIEDWQRDGHYRIPVFVGSAQWKLDDDEEDIPSVRNGTHRVVASIVGKIPTVQFTWEDDPEYSYDEQNPIRVTILTKESDDEFFSDFLFDSLRSFRLSEKEWVTTDYSFGTQIKVELFYEGVPPTEENIERVRLKVDDIIESSKYCNEVFSISADEYIYEDDEDEESSLDTIHE